MTATTSPRRNTKAARNAEKYAAMQAFFTRATIAGKRAMAAIEARRVVVVATVQGEVCK